MEFLNEIWVWIMSAVGGISLSAIISTIIYGCLKGAFNRTINKINVEKIAEKATDKGVEKVKTYTFKHSIQPIVESELAKIDERIAKQFKDELAKVQDNYNNIIKVLEKLSAYFDGSIGVSEQAKAELKQALSDAQNEPSKAQSEFIEIIVEDTKEPTTPQKQSDSTINVIR